MNDQDACVDFTGFFSKQVAAKGHQRKLKRNKLGTSKVGLQEKKHSAKGRGLFDAREQQESRPQKRKAEGACANDRSGIVKRGKACSEAEHSTHHGGRSQENQRVSKGFWPFEVDYNDHFETPLQAVQDIAPVLLLLSKKLKKHKSNLAIYDPFFCQGGIRRHYEQLGFKNFTHRNRDFYQDVNLGNLPSYDILITNPPYSADHKERILEFCLQSGKPWALLLPNYVATKAYFGLLLDSASIPASQRPFFLTPRARYSYDHPEGTGHPESPFFSIWYVGLAEHTEAIHGACKARLQAGTAAAGAKTADSSSKGGNDAIWGVSITRTVDALRQAGAVPIARRLNPKQRARLKEQRLKAVQ